MTEDIETTSLTRRELLAGAGLTLGGAAGGYGLARRARPDPNPYENGEWPYWTDHFEITQFRAEPSEHGGGLVVTVGVQYQGDDKKTWPGVIWAANLTQYDFIHGAPAPEVGPNSDPFAQSYDAEPGEWEIGIQGAGRMITGVEVPPNVKAGGDS